MIDLFELLDPDWMKIYIQPNRILMSFKQISLCFSHLTIDLYKII